ncbi:MAG TPA: hypothetical protein VGI64_22835 [Streptosporangiaceae bacterium]
MPYLTALEAGDPGQAGPYQLARRIAGMPGAGPTYLGLSPGGAEVTVTLVPGDWTVNPAARDRFAAEATGARQVPPYCAARILDAGIDDSGLAFLVSEHVPGESLAEAVAAGGASSQDQLAAAAVGAATGLASVHQAGLVHGSFGPGHLVLGQAGPTVIQFGVTPPYGPATPAADMLAWAQTMVFAAAGRPPAGPADLSLLPEPLRQLAAGCLSPAADDRPDARSVVSELLGDGFGLPVPELAVPELLTAGARQAGRLTVPADELAGQAGRQAARYQPARQPLTQPQSQPSHQVSGPGAGPVPGREHGRHQPVGRSRAITVVWAAVAIAIVLAVSILVHVMQNGDSQQRIGGAPAVGRSGTASVRAGSSPAASRASPLPSGNATSPGSPAVIPQVLAGRWAGQVSQGSPAVVLTVRISLPGGQSAGQISYSGTGLACKGRLSLVSAAARTARLRQSIVTGKGSCAGGVIRLRQDADGMLSFLFRGRAGPSASGKLSQG